MSTCTFFGHRQSPPALRPQLRSVRIDLIEGQGVHTFYVGNQVILTIWFIPFGMSAVRNIPESPMELFWHTCLRSGQICQPGQKDGKEGGQSRLSQWGDTVHRKAVTRDIPLK